MVRSARSRALASAVALAAAAAALAGAPRVAALDPCRSQPDAVQRDDGFVVGLALGGSDAVVWDGRHPCNAADRAALAGVKVAAYRTRADELDALRFECDQLGSGKELSPGEHEDLMMRCPASWAVRMDDTFERFPNASVVAFARHGQSLKRSPPRPFRTVLGAGDPSGATAAHVTELRLVLRFVDGMLDSLLVRSRQAACADTARECVRARADARRPAPAYPRSCARTTAAARAQWADTGCSKCEGVTGQAQAASHTCVADNCALRNTYCLTEATEVRERRTEGALACLSQRACLRNPSCGGGGGCTPRSLTARNPPLCAGPGQRGGLPPARVCVVGGDRLGRSAAQERQATSIYWQPRGERRRHIGRHHRDRRHERRRRRGHRWCQQRNQQDCRDLRREAVIGRARGTVSRASCMALG